MKGVIKRLSGRQKGGSLIETAVALAILGLIAVAILSALGTGAKATNIAKEQATAESLARCEIEYIKGYPYAYLAPTYPIDPVLAVHEAEGWSISPPVVELVHASDDGIQKITVTVKRYDKTLLTVSTYKVDR